MRKQVSYLKANEPNIPLHLGEVNSNTYSSGNADILGVFGSALWLADYMLYGMTLNIKRMNVQQSSGFSYTSWYIKPLPNPTTPTNITTPGSPPNTGASPPKSTHPTTPTPTSPTSSAPPTTSKSPTSASTRTPSPPTASTTLPQTKSNASCC